MSFVKKIETEAGYLGIWELNETVDELKKEFNFSTGETIEYEKIKFDQRKKEYLSTRLLVEKLLGEKHEIDYLHTRKPVIKNESLFISISHSKDLVVVLISKNHETGIDVERIDREVDKVVKRFLSPEEINDIFQLQDPQIGKITYWCAKESIFKCSCFEGILFNSQISILPFPINNSGTFTGNLIQGVIQEHYKLWYFLFKNNMVVYCVALNVSK